MPKTGIKTAERQKPKRLLKDAPTVKQRDCKTQGFLEFLLNLEHKLRSRRLEDVSLPKPNARHNARAVQERLTNKAAPMTERDLHCARG